MFYFDKILDNLANKRFGDIAGRLYKEIDPETSPETFRSILSNMVKRGHLYVDGRVECKECGANHNCYRITERGRIWKR